MAGGSAASPLVRDGAFASRSEAVRAGLDLVLAHGRERAIDQAFAAGFAQLPDTDQELVAAEALGRRSIEEEPWEPWW